MATIREKKEMMDKYAEDFREAVKEKEENTERYIKAFFG